MPDQPIKEFRCGTITAAIWRKESQKEGRAVVNHSIRLQKRYRDKKTGEWKDSDHLFPDELPKAVLVLGSAYQWVALTESDEKDGSPVE